ncbi:MAG: deoxyribose-phosphate aldolase [Phycisphaerae bacterium]|nr:deoxyribose-phosphate aldolase [Phycisphaerae bacterium]
MELTVNNIARMLDISEVKADSTENDIRKMAKLAIKYNCIACFAMPSYTTLIVDLLKNSPQINVGGVVGFPSGANTTLAKVAEAHEMIEMGCNELDMVINIGRLKSGDLSYVYEDIAAVVKAAGNLPVKVILECHYLTNDEIKTACQLGAKAGVSFIKTGTGWASTGATSDNIELINSCVGAEVEIKAAGGVRDLDTLLDLHKLGATRFGVGQKSATLILQEMEQRENEFIHHSL